jgi:hypothetical protein
MTFKVNSSTDIFTYKDVEINTLEDLKQFQENLPICDFCGLDGRKPELIVDFQEMTILIYDYYIE